MSRSTLLFNKIYIMNKKLIAVAALAICVIIGCVVWISRYDNSRDALEAEVDAFAGKCPVELVPGNVIEKLSYDKHTNVVTADMAATYYEYLDSIDRSIQTRKISLLFQSPESRALIKYMAKAGASLELCYGQSAGESIYPGISYFDMTDKFVFTPAEIANLESKPLLTGKEQAEIGLRYRALMLSALCPMPWGDNSTLRDIERDKQGHRVIFSIDAGPDVKASEYQTKLFKSELKAQRHESTLIHDLVKEIADVGFSIQVLYVTGNDNNVVAAIDIPRQDIYNISQLH